MNNDDLISRQAAINKVKEHRAMFCDNTPESFSWLPYGDKCRVDEMDSIIAMLINLPSVQPEIEPKTGQWIANDDYDGEVYYTCSRCEEPWVTIDGTPQENRMRYCPHCGAKMKGGEEHG